MVDYAKEDILEEVLHSLEKVLYEVKASSKHTKEQAIQAPSASESHSDTSKNQLQALSYSLDERVYTLEEEIKAIISYKVIDNLSKVVLGSLVELENLDSGEEKYYYVLPAGAGTQVQTEKGLVNIITTKSPIFVSMFGKIEGDDFEFRYGDLTQEYSITKID
ncbi:MAG: GreA/GreB family elongation factor [Candidatus Pacearchaeota archaeon]|nr:GreA/GreB family elongation factor [Candidatus Pacearchaeota archaeon]